MGIKTDWKEKDFVDFVKGKLSELDGRQMIAYLESNYGKKILKNLKIYILQNIPKPISNICQK